MAPSNTSVEALAAKASKLNAKTDELNAAFEYLEARLAAANVGVSVWLPLRELLDIDHGRPSESTASDDDETWTGSDDGWNIGYTKVGAKWRLAAREERWTYSTDGAEKTFNDVPIIVSAPVPLVSAPRAVRAEAAGLLDLLIEELTKQVDFYLANIEKAISTAAKGAPDGAPVEATSSDLSKQNPRRRPS